MSKARDKFIDSIKEQAKNTNDVNITKPVVTNTTDASNGPLPHSSGEGLFSGYKASSRAGSHTVLNPEPPHSSSSSNPMIKK